MIDNLNFIYDSLHELPDNVESVEQFSELLSKHGPSYNTTAKREELTKATVYKYHLARNGFGIALHIRTMHGPFAVQGFILHVGMKRYPCVVLGSEVTINDYGYTDKPVVEEVLSKMSLLITDITLGYKSEAL